MNIRTDIQRRTVTALKKIQSATGVPGISVAFSKGGEGAFQISVGKSSLNDNSKLSTSSRFEISCLMKFFVALVTLELAARGNICLDTLIQTYLPEMSGDPFKKGNEITIRHLISHTSGYLGLDIANSQVRWNFSWDRFVAHFNHFEPLFSPGEVFNYEHSEAVILGEIIHRATGASARQLVEKWIFEPLNIVPGTTSSDKSNPSIFVASHGYSSDAQRFSPLSIPPFGKFWDASLPDWTLGVSDLHTIGANLIKKRTARSCPVFSPSTLEELGKHAVAIPAGINSNSFSENFPHYFGFGAARYADGWLGHNGSVLGQTCGLRFNPQSGITVAVGVNAWSPYARDTALQYICALASGLPVTSIGAASLRVLFPLRKLTNGFSISDICGHYIGSYLGSIAITKNDDGLAIELGRGRAKRTIQIMPAEEDNFEIITHLPATIGFSKDPLTGAPVLFLGMYSYKKAA